MHGVLSLSQHLSDMRLSPESYRPKMCPCGFSKLWFHGSYTRKFVQYDLGDLRLDPVPVLRFYCPDCKHTCSVLPECIPPRSWFLWKTRQVIFLLLLAGNSLDRTHASNGSPVSRDSIKRWWRHFRSEFSTYSFHLLTFFPCLGRHPELSDFWRTLLGLRSLSSAMLMLHQEGVVVP